MVSRELRGVDVVGVLLDNTRGSECRHSRRSHVCHGFLFELFQSLELGCQLKEDIAHVAGLLEQ
jgi:hypothetical protein